MKFSKLLAALLVSSCVLWAGNASAMTLRIGAGDPEDSEMGVVGNTFKKFIEEKTNGKVKVELFFNASLGDETECLRNVQKGTLPATIAGIANIVPFQSKLGILTLPYLFSNLDEVVVGTNGEPAEILNKYAIEAGFRVLTWTYTDFRYISNSKHPIETIDDMKDLKFRVPQSAVLIAAYKAFGGSPTPISWAETFTALQQGVVDGQCYGYIGFRANKFIEANQKYISEVHYTYQLQPLVMSERVFRKMDPELQALVIEGGKVAQQAVLEYQINQAKAAKEYLISQGVVVSELKDEEKWKKAAFEKVWPEMMEFVGGIDAVNTYLKACGKPEFK